MRDSAARRLVFLFCLAASSCTSSVGGDIHGASSRALRTVVIAEPAMPPKSANLPPVTIDAILQRRMPTLNALRWRGNDHLAVDVQLAGEEAAATRLVDMNGALSEPVEAERGTPSPDGTVTLVRGDAGWELIDIATGAKTPVPTPTDEHEFMRLMHPIWSPDGRFVAIAEFESYFNPARPTPVVVDGVPVIDVGRSADEFRLRPSRVTIIDRTRPDKPQHIPLDDAIYFIAWGDGVLYGTRAVFGGSDPYTDILAIPASGGELRSIYRTPGRFQMMAPTVSPGGQVIAAALDVDHRKWDDFTSLVLIDPATGAETRLTHDLAIRGRSLIWSRDGAAIYAEARSGGLNQIWEIPLVGEPRQLTSGPRRHFNATLSPNGRRLAYETEDGYGRRDVRVLDLQTGEERVPLIIDEPAREFALGAWRQIRWESTDGVRPYGYVILPPDFDETRQYPMLVDIHGGGEGSFLYLFGSITVAVARGPLEWHAWAALGYVVFVPDYRSTGDYGPDAIARRYVRNGFAPFDDSIDAVTGVRHMLTQRYIDPARIAMFGHSAGGPRVYNAVAANPGLFAAAIINDGGPPDPVSTSLANLSGYLTGGQNVGALEDYFGASLAAAPERYAANTIFDAAKIDTPMLFLMGSGPPRGMDHWPWQVVFSILRSRGTPARMLVFTEEGHNYSTRASARLAFETTRNWLETHMPETRTARDH